MNKNKIVLLVGVALAVPAAARGAGTTAALFLRQEPTARVTAMGGAAAALDDDAGAVYFNPAGLAFTPATRLSLSTWKGVDEMSRADFISGIYDTGRYGVFSLTYLDYGSGSENIYDIDGNLSSVNLSQEYAVGAGGGYKVADNLSLGAQLKYVRSTLAETYKANTGTFDFGVMYKLWKNRFSAGAGVQNAASSLKYISASDPLPRVYYGGAAMKFMFGNWGGLLAAADLQQASDEVRPESHLGLEYTKDILALRVGMKHIPGITSATLGAGIKLKWFSFDYGFQSQGKLDEPINKFTLNVFFDAFTSKKTEPAPTAEGSAMPEASTAGLAPDKGLPPAQSL